MFVGKPKCLVFGIVVVPMNMKTKRYAEKKQLLIFVVDDNTIMSNDRRDDLLPVERPWCCDEKTKRRKV